MKNAGSTRRGVTVASARKLLLGLPGVEEGLSYGMPSFKTKGRFFARFRDDDTVLVLALSAMVERDWLVQQDPDAFFFTEHYRAYPAVLVRLDSVPAQMLDDLVRGAHEYAMTRPAVRPSKRRR
jgi:hypothetical protein